MLTLNVSHSHPLHVAGTPSTQLLPALLFEFLASAPSVPSHVTASVHLQQFYLLKSIASFRTVFRGYSFPFRSHWFYKQIQIIPCLYAPCYDMSVPCWTGVVHTHADCHMTEKAHERQGWLLPCGVPPFSTASSKGMKRGDVGKIFNLCILKFHSFFKIFFHEAFVNPLKLTVLFSSEKHIYGPYYSTPCIKISRLYVLPYYLLFQT